MKSKISPLDTALPTAHKEAIIAHKIQNDFIVSNCSTVGGAQHKTKKHKISKQVDLKLALTKLALELRVEYITESRNRNPQK